MADKRADEAQTYTVDDPTQEYTANGEPLDADCEDVQPPAELTTLHEVMAWKEAAAKEARKSTVKKGADAE